MTTPLEKIPCGHGNSYSLHATDKPVHAWTHVFWPVALLVAMALFFVPYYGERPWTGWGLLAGAFLLGIPELITLLTGNAQDTFSDWVWNTAHVAAGKSIASWDAGHYFLACAYVFIVANVTVYLAGIDWRAGLGAGLFSSWLLFHFWCRWWT